MTFGSRYRKGGRAEEVEEQAYIEDAEYEQCLAEEYHASMFDDSEERRADVALTLAELRAEECEEARQLRALLRDCARNSSGEAGCA